MTTAAHDMQKGLRLFLPGDSSKHPPETLHGKKGRKFRVKPCIRESSDSTHTIYPTPPLPCIPAKNPSNDGMHKMKSDRKICRCNLRACSTTRYSQAAHEHE
jgi:hypothetical protein